MSIPASRVPDDDGLSDDTAGKKIKTQLHFLLRLPFSSLCNFDGLPVGALERHWHFLASNARDLKYVQRLLREYTS